MPSLPSVTGTQAIRAFSKAGFSVARIKGSHHIMSKPGHPHVVSVPVHGNAPLKSGTLRSLVRDAGLTVEGFIALLS